MASVAQITGSIISSGCNHIIPVRVSYDTMVNLCCDRDRGESGDKFLRDKHKFSAHKDDLLLSCSGHMFPGGEGYFKSKQAYPPVISNLADSPPDLRRLIIDFYRRPVGDYDVNEYDEEDRESGGDSAKRLETYKNFLPEFRFMGFSCGQAFVHPSSGDTVVSSYIGGMTTVRNGHFPLKTGDLVMWYWDFECEQFDEYGHRIHEGAEDGVATGAHCFSGEGGVDAKRRKMAHERGNGNIAEHGRMMPYKSDKGGIGFKNNIPMVKPYFHDIFGQQGVDRDRSRVFGRCMANARPFDMVDLQVCSQAI